MPLHAFPNLLQEFLAGNGKGVIMSDALPLLEGGMESGHGFCPSDPEKWRSVVMVTPIPFPEGRWEGEPTQASRSERELGMRPPRRPDVKEY